MTLNKESDRLLSIESDRLDDLLDYPATSVADLAYKLAAVLGVWREEQRLDEYHEILAVAFLQDAERVLRPLLPAEPIPVAGA